MDLRQGDGLIVRTKLWPIFKRTNYILGCPQFAWAAMEYLGGPEMQEAVANALEDEQQYEEDEDEDPDADGDLVARVKDVGNRAYLFPNFANNKPDFTRRRVEPYSTFWARAAERLGADGDTSSKAFRRLLPVFAQTMNASPHHTAQHGGWESSRVMANNYEDTDTYYRREMAARALMGVPGPVPGATSITQPIIPWKVTSGVTLVSLPSSFLLYTPLSLTTSTPTHTHAPPTHTHQTPPADSAARRQYMTTSILHLALGKEPLIHEDRRRRVRWFLDAIDEREREAKAAPSVDVARAVAMAGPAAAAAAFGGVAAAGAVPWPVGALGAAGGVAGAALLGAYLELHITGSSFAVGVATAFFCAFFFAGAPLTPAFCASLCVCTCIQLYLTYGAFFPSSPSLCVRARSPPC